MTTSEARGGGLSQLRALLVAWLTQDLLGKSRRTGRRSVSSLTPTLFSQGFLTFAFAALTYQDVGTRAFVAGNIAFAMALTLTAMMGEFPGEDRRRADEDFVLTSPVSTVVFHLAKAVHSLLVLLLFHLGLVLAPAILGMWNGGIAYVWALPLVSLLLLGGSAGILSSLMELIQKTRGPSAVASFTSLVQTLLVSGLFLGSLLGLRAMFQGVSAFPGGAALLHFLPPYWGARVAEWLVEGHGPGEYGWFFIAFVLLPIGLQVLASIIPARPRVGKPRRERVPLSASLFSASREDRGVLRFSLTLLARDPAFRLRAIPLLGLPVAVVLLALHSGVSAREIPFFFALVHNLPLAWLPFLLHFVPYAMDFEASWLTRMGPQDPVLAGRRGILLSFAVILLRLQFLLFLLDLGFRGLGPSLLSSLSGLGLSFVLLPFLLASLEEVPFSEDPAHLKPPDMGSGMILLSILVPVLSMGFEALPRAWGALLCVLLLGAGRHLVATSFRLGRIRA